VHRKGLLCADIAGSAAGAEAFVHGGAEIEDESTDETDVEKLIQEEEGRWNDRRLVLFTEYEDSRRWLEKRLAEALDDLQPDDRISSFTGATPLVRREDLKRRFNADPAKDPLRILICTDAAREGINLQRRCHDLIHLDLPWNPARLAAADRPGHVLHRTSARICCWYFRATMHDAY
jgi:SNF2 family DNA or RNA helicase